MKKIDKNELIEKLIAIDKFEAFNFFDYMLAYSYMFPNGLVANNWNKFKKNLTQALKTIDCFEISVPKEYTPKVFEKIKSEVNKA
jgi:hypothetical protein